MPNNKPTRQQMIRFIAGNFTWSKTGKKITQKELQEKTTESLANFIFPKHEEAFNKFLSLPKLKWYLVLVEEGEDQRGYECEAGSEDLIQKQFSGKKIIKIAPRSGNHWCRYCGGIAATGEKDILCDECQEVFGHYRYSDL